MVAIAMLGETRAIGSAARSETDITRRATDERLRYVVRKVVSCRR